MELTFVDERPSTLAAAWLPAEIVAAAHCAPQAHASVVGRRPVRVRTTGTGLADQGISVSVFGFELPTATTSKINYITGTASAKGEGMATALEGQKVSVSRDQKVRNAEVRGIPPRGRPV